MSLDPGQEVVDEDLWVEEVAGVSDPLDVKKSIPLLQPSFNFLFQKSTAPYIRQISYSKSIKSCLVGGTAGYTHRCKPVV